MEILSVMSDPAALVNVIALAVVWSIVNIVWAWYKTNSAVTTLEGARWLATVCALWIFRVVATPTYTAPYTWIAILISALNFMTSITIALAERKPKAA